MKPIKPYRETACKDCEGNEVKKTISGRCFEAPYFHYQKFQQRKYREKQKSRNKKPVKIAPISRNRQEALKKYRRLRDKYFEENPICEFPGCNSREITLHHARGRYGAFLTDKRYFKSL